MPGICREPLHVFRSNHICMRVLKICRDDCGNFFGFRIFFSPCLSNDFDSDSTRKRRDSEIAPTNLSNNFGSDSTFCEDLEQ